MNRLIAAGVCVLFLGCSASRKMSQPTGLWKEAGINTATDIKPGIPAYSDTSIDYQRGNNTVLHVTLEKPVVVGVADKPQGWGYFQFPVIYWGLDHSLVAKWNMAADAVDSYGKGGANYEVSKDGGKTWGVAQHQPVPGGGLVLGDGSRIAVYTPPAQKEENLHLPDTVDAPAARSKGYKFYKLAELPAALQGVYLNRMGKGETTWKVEQATLEDPAAIRYSRKGLFPVVWWGDLHQVADGSIMNGIYPGFYLDQEGKIAPGGVFFYRSTDQGHSWQLRSRILYQPDLQADPNGAKRTVMGFTEPGFEILADGSFLCVMRTADGLGNSPMYYSRSTDQGRTWTTPKPFTRTGVLPRLLQLKNGVVVLAAGRPGVQLRFAVDGKGEQWTDPFEMLPFEGDKEAVSCGYTELLATGPDRFLLIYSDFNYLTDQKDIRKAIKVREVIVTPK